MKLNLANIAFALTFPTAIFAQNKNLEISDYHNTLSSGSADIVEFTKDQKRFNDWSISGGLGVPLLQSADLTSIKNGNGTNLLGHSFYLSVDKAITHAFGLKLQFDMGKTKQGDFDINDLGTPGKFAGKTTYMAVSALADVNFSNLFRRVDNRSTFKWALHGYAGIGTIAYKAYLRAGGSNVVYLNTNQPFALGSFFAQTGGGVKYKLSRRVDLEGRMMYVVTGDDEFDGGGHPRSIVNGRSEQVSDNFFNITLGATFKLGKNNSHLFWHDPLQELYYKIGTIDVEVCKKGDKDNDGVCDDWDRQLDTPAGARVDGAGIALDIDLDGVIDLNDECVTVPGPIENNGCPIEPKAPEPVKEKPKASPISMSVVTEINKHFEGIEFELNKDVIRPQSFEKLNHAASIIKTLNPNDKYLVVGATDTRGSDQYNLKLSQKRAASVVRYLVDKGVPSSMLIPEGRGKNDLKYPECNPATNCPEWKNEANRRVFFEAR